MKQNIKVEYQDKPMGWTITSESLKNNECYTTTKNEV